MHIDKRLTQGPFDWLSGKGTTTAMHEVVAHAMAAVSFNKEDKNTYAYELSQNKGRGFTPKQGRTILSHLQAGRLNQGPVTSSLPSKDTRNPYVSPYLGGLHSSGRSGNIFDRRVGVNRKKYMKAVVNRQ